MEFQLIWCWLLDLASYSSSRMPKVAAHARPWAHSHVENITGILIFFSHKTSLLIWFWVFLDALLVMVGVNIIDSFSGSCAPNMIPQEHRLLSICLYLKEKNRISTRAFFFCEFFLLRFSLYCVIV